MACGSGGSCGSKSSEPTDKSSAGFVPLTLIGSAAPVFAKINVAPSNHAAKRLMVGLDVGSTTVKAVVVDPETDEMIWQDYQRHDTKQPEKCLEFLKRMAEEAGIAPGTTRVFVTGSGGGNISGFIGAKFVQEVNAVALAVEKLYPQCGSVVELGGQ